MRHGDTRPGLNQLYNSKAYQYCCKAHSKGGEDRRISRVVDDKAKKEAGNLCRFRSFQSPRSCTELLLLRHTMPPGSKEMS